MRRFVLVTTALALCCAAAAPLEDAKVPAVLSFKMKDINGKDVDLAQYQGKVLLVVNVASKCGYTKQYKGLEALYQKYKDQGFVVLGFPCNQFGNQEPGTEQEIAEFCTAKFRVTFPMFTKVEVNGAGRADLYKALVKEAPGNHKDIAWNFEKFLVSRKGDVVARFKSQAAPEAKELVAAVETELAKK